MTRAEKVAEAQRLRGEGLLLREIAERMGAKRSTVHAWISDPDLSKQRARRKRYAGACANCGAPTDGSNGAAAAPALCDGCFKEKRHAERYWTQGRVIAAIQEWARRHGRPPIAPEWLSSEHDSEFPWCNTVQREFGSWAAAIEAAGFPRPLVGHYGRPGEDPEVVAETIRLYRAGLSCAEIAGRMGCSGNAIRMRLVAAGEPRRPARRRTDAERAPWSPHDRLPPRSPLPHPAGSRESTQRT